MAKLILRSDGVGKEFDLEKTGSLTVGRAPDCDIPITDSQASRRHCSVVRLQSGYEVADLGSTNGTLVNSTLVKKQKLKHGDVIRIGQVEIAFDDPSSAGGGGSEPAVGYLVHAKGDKKGQRVELTLQRTTIGRKETNTVVIDDPVSSSYHCEIVRGLNGYTIRDLGSTNGTLVNSEMVTEAPLSHGARIRIGNTRFVFQDPAMAEIDLELAGAEDEDEWGMMRDIDLAAVRKRNPATIAYAVLFVAILGAGGYFLSMEKKTTGTGIDAGPAGNLHGDYSFEGADPFWRGEPDVGVTISTSTQVKGSGTRSLEIRTSVADAAAFYETRLPVERKVYRLKGLVAARGAKASLGLLWLGSGIRRWATAPAVASSGLTPVDVALSAPSWATGAFLGVRIEGEGAVYIDDLVLLKEAAESRVQQVTVGEFRIDVTDGRGLELFYSGAPVLVNGRAMAEGGEDAGLSIKAESEDAEHVLITIEGSSGAERAGVVLDEVSGFLRDGFRAFTPDDPEKKFHPAFPDEKVLPLRGVSKLLLGPAGSRSFAALACEGGRLDAEARADGPTRALALLGPVADGKFAFRLKLDLTGENRLAIDSISAALELDNRKRWGEFQVAATEALARYPFANQTSRRQLSQRVGQVIEEYEKRRGNIDRLLEEYRAFKDREDLEQAGALLKELETLYQIKPGEGTRGQYLAETRTEVENLDLAARKERQSKASDPTWIQAMMVDRQDGRDFSAALQFYYISAFLPDAQKAGDAGAEFQKLAQKHPQLARVLDKLGFKRVR